MILSFLNISHASYILFLISTYFLYPESRKMQRYKGKMFVHECIEIEKKESKYS